MDAGFFLDLIFPAACVACDARIPRGALCRDCRAKMVPHRTAFCGTCSAPLPGFRNICHPRTPYLMGAAGDYRNKTMRALVHALKFGRIKGAAEPLADMLIHYVARLPIDLRGFTVMPMPISKERMAERGFNQSALIAEQMARFFGLPFEKNILIRIAHRTAQSEIEDHAERRGNIRGCYAIRRRKEYAYPAAEMGKIILIDDVTTSGATFTEAATVLRAAGARKIFALAAAKAK